MPKKAPPKDIYQLKVTLVGIKPPIWRRLQVPGSITLAQLHDVLQEVMGWSDSHLHQFIIGDTYYGRSDPDFGLEDVEDERKVKLNQVVHGAKEKFAYEYDFGDSWEHHVVVEKILPPEPGERYPVCVDGKRNCPPEDCGGIWGYGDFPKAIGDPNHPEHENLLEWSGGQFDPEEFSVAEVNRRLRA